MSNSCTRYGRSGSASEIGSSPTTVGWWLRWWPGTRIGSGASTAAHPAAVPRWAVLPAGHPSAASNAGVHRRSAMGRCSGSPAASTGGSSTRETALDDDGFGLRGRTDVDDRERRRGRVLGLGIRESLGAPLLDGRLVGRAPRDAHARRVGRPVRRVRHAGPNTGGAAEGAASRSRIVDGNVTSATRPTGAPGRSSTMMRWRAASDATTWRPRARESARPTTGGLASSWFASAIFSGGMPMPRSETASTNPRCGVGARHDDRARPVARTTSRSRAVPRRGARGRRRLGRRPRARRRRRRARHVGNRRSLPTPNVRRRATRSAGATGAAARHRTGPGDSPHSAHARRHVIELEQCVERRGIVLVALELVEQLELALEEALVPAGEVHEQISHALAQEQSLVARDSHRHGFDVVEGARELADLIVRVDLDRRKGRPHRPRRRLASSSTSCGNCLCDISRALSVSVRSGRMTARATIQIKRDREEHREDRRSAVDPHIRAGAGSLRGGPRGDRPVDRLDRVVEVLRLLLVRKEVVRWSVDVRCGGERRRQGRGRIRRPHEVRCRLDLAHRGLERREIGRGLPSQGTADGRATRRRSRAATSRSRSLHPWRARGSAPLPRVRAASAPARARTHRSRST